MMYYIVKIASVQGFVLMMMDMSFSFRMPCILPVFFHPSSPS